MPKITFLGAGSTVFARNLAGDILSYPELADIELALFDIDPERLETSRVVAHKVAEALGARPAIVATTDRHAALDGADYAVNMIQVGGYRPATVLDFEIPKRFGLRQTIGDTLGIGGIMRALRTVPVLLDMVRDMERLCPDVVHLSYVNPMAINTWALRRASSVRTVGLCHSVPHSAAQLCHDIGVPLAEVNYLVAGINHMAFFLRFEREGEDLYPQLRRQLERPAPRRPIGAEGVQMTDAVRYDLLRHFGYFVTESSEHLAEYVPWYIKAGREDVLERFDIPLDEYPRRCEEQIRGWERLRDELEGGSGGVEVARSVEFGSQIIHSLETGTPRVVYGNVPNSGSIDNLPAECCVEVPCLVDGNGVQPVHVGALPPQLAALIQTNVNVQALTVEAVLSGRRDHVYQAAMLDPHTAAELDPEQIVQLVDQLLEAHAGWLPELTRA
ncbi:MAG TPA: alpha-glucosidase/alpha-galactosidase [Trueperaceae bacterium]|nr:alpha-glucosidase/alpha-galactosidase [Trueperaceae bacterium]